MRGRLRRTPGSEQGTRSTGSSKASIPQTGSRCRQWEPGVRERRIHTDREYRVIHVAKFDEGIYVLHAFEKKTRRTRREDIDLARKRFQAVLRGRGRGNAGPDRG